MPRGAMRLLAICLAALQVILPGAVSIADARLDAETLAVSTRGHVESQSSTDCPRVHALDCALCQFLSSARGEPAPGEQLVAADRETTNEMRGDRDRAASNVASLPPSRGPPALS